MTWLARWQHFHRPPNRTVHAPSLQNPKATYQEIAEPKLRVHIGAKESMRDRKQVTHISIFQNRLLHSTKHHISYTFRKSQRSINKGENSPIFSPFLLFFGGYFESWLWVSSRMESASSCYAVPSCLLAPSPATLFRHVLIKKLGWKVATRQPETATWRCSVSTETYGQLQTKWQPPAGPG